MGYFAAFCKVITSGGDNDMEGTSRRVRRNSTLTRSTRMNNERLSFMARKSHRLSVSKPRSSLTSGNIEENKDKPEQTYPLREQRGSKRVSFVETSDAERILALVSGMDSDQANPQSSISYPLSETNSSQELGNERTMIHNEDAAVEEQGTNLDVDENDGDVQV